MEYSFQFGLKKDSVYIYPYIAFEDLESDKLGFFDISLRTFIKQKVNISCPFDDPKYYTTAEQVIENMVKVLEESEKVFNEDFDTIPKIIEIYKSEKYPDYTYNSIQGVLNFGLLSLLYDETKYGIELLNKFLDEDFTYKIFEEIKTPPSTVIRLDYVKKILITPKDQIKVRELILEMTQEIENLHK